METKMAITHPINLAGLPAEDPKRRAINQNSG